MGVAHALGDGLLVEIEAGEIARIGGVAKTQVDGIGAIVDGRFQGRQAAGGADQFQRSGHAGGGG
ncbi:hypothetical protein D3C72_2212850 [compost metagenome]